MGVLLTILATVLMFLIGIPGMLYSAVRMMVRRNIRTWWKELNRHLHQYARALDKAGNVLCRIPLDQTCRKAMGYPFGDGLETVSYVLAVNQRSSSLTKFGKAVVRVLEFVDRGHMQKAIDGHNAEFEELGVFLSIDRAAISWWNQLPAAEKSAYLPGWWQMNVDLPTKIKLFKRSVLSVEYRHQRSNY